jgi:hypothetical protein
MYSSTSGVPAFTQRHIWTNHYLPVNLSSRNASRRPLMSPQTPHNRTLCIRDGCSWSYHRTTAPSVSLEPWNVGCLGYSKSCPLLTPATAAADGLQSRNWTTVQIVVPILVGLAVGVAGVFLGFFIYRRRRNANRERPWMQTTGNRPRFQFPTWSSRQKVRELNRSTSWSIDQGEEDLQEYQFVSYPASLQGSRASGHVRLSSSSSIQAGPPPLKIPSDQKPPVWTWPGKSIWKGPLQSARQLGDSIPRPWRSTKRVPVKNIPGYNKFRVDGADSDSPLSQRPHTESLLGHTGRSRTNLHQETIFEGENEDDSDSDEEALPFIPQEHSRSNHDAEPPTNAVLYISPDSGTGTESPGDSNGSRIPRQIPPASVPPSIPLPLLPPVPTQVSKMIIVIRTP